MTQLLFVLSWFHALIQERRKYIPQGWSKYYEFSFGDLKAGELTLADIVQESKGGNPQWQKIYGILENAIYGGRIDNVFDLRVLRAYIDEYFNESTIRGQKSLSNIIPVPQSANPRDFVGMIQKIPDQDVPALFGLPANIDRSVQRFNSQQVINQLKKMAAVSEGELRFDLAKWTKVLGPICSAWAQLYKPEVFEKINITQDHLNSPDPVEGFVFMEIVTVKEILQYVHQSIQTIARILQGSEMLTDKSQKEASQLMKGQVPPSWETQWEGPENPADWIRVVNRKANALVGWLQRIQQKQLLERPVNLSDLFHPETFLNALRQRSARKLKLAIDELKLVSAFEANKVPRDSGVQVEGMWMQGCEFDGKRMNDIQNSSQELISLPTCYMGWISQKDPEPYADSVVTTPIYHALDRETLLCTIDVPNNGAEQARIIGGSAIFLVGSVAG